MAGVQIDAAPDVPKEPKERSVMVEQLDGLLEKYLTTLDQYQKARQALANHLSSGYLSLAEANFSNRTRVRYGQDYYDERMQAITTLTVAAKESGTTFSTVRPEITPVPTDPQPLPTPDSTNTGNANIELRQPFAKSIIPPETSKAASDPLRWFGVLHPTSLRIAQDSFISAVEGPIPHLATLNNNLRRQESDIARLRKQIKRL